MLIKIKNIFPILHSYTAQNFNDLKCHFSSKQTFQQWMLGCLATKLSHQVKTPAILTYVKYFSPTDKLSLSFGLFSPWSQLYYHFVCNPTAGQTTRKWNKLRVPLSHTKIWRLTVTFTLVNRNDSCLEYISTNLCFSYFISLENSAWVIKTKGCHREIEMHCFHLAFVFWQWVSYMWLVR